MKTLKTLKTLTLCILVMSMLLTIQNFSYAAKYPMKVKDCRNKTVLIPKEPMRIISLTPSNTEILFSIGAGKKIVGVNSWSDYPAAAKKLPSVGDHIISVEKVLSLKPDFILAHGTLNDDAIRSLEARKLKVFVIDPLTINQLAADIKTIGRITNTEKRSKAVANEILTAKAAIVKRAAKFKTKPKVLFSVQTDPLWAAGPKTYVDEIIRISGGVNLASDIKPGFNRFSLEMAIRQNPDIIITTTKNDIKRFVKGQWKVTNAAKKGRVYAINPDYIVRPSPRIVIGMKQISKMVHPDAKK